jgi:predicted aminopeptidase
MWVVTASKPFSMEAHEWTFPFLGSLSYKGFFREELALEEAAQVRKEGYETDIYNPSAWSTLGWMNDPILSGMLHKGPGQLAELIIHELTHATVFLPGQVEYNENLATFIGEQGALLFLSSHFGTNSPEKIRYENFLHDQIIYAKHLLKGAESLDSLYKTFTSDELISSRAEKKYRLISSIFLNINYLPLKEPKRYLFDFRQEQLPGNTTFMAYRRYRKDQAELYKLLNEEYEGDLRKMIAGLSEK